MKKVLNKDLDLRAYQRKTGHHLNARLMDLRLKSSRALLKQSAGKNRMKKFLPWRKTPKKKYSVPAKFCVSS